MIFTVMCVLVTGCGNKTVKVESPKGEAENSVVESDEALETQSEKMSANDEEETKDVEESKDAEVATGDIVEIPFALYEGETYKEVVKVKVPADWELSVYSFLNPESMYPADRTGRLKPIGEWLEERLPVEDMIPHLYVFQRPGHTEWMQVYPKGQEELYKPTYQTSEDDGNVTNVSKESGEASGFTYEYLYVEIEDDQADYNFYCEYSLSDELVFIYEIVRCEGKDFDPEAKAKEIAATITVL